MAITGEKVETPVKVALPTLTVFSDRINFKSLLLKGACTIFPAIVVEYVQFTDRFGKKTKSASKYMPAKGGSHHLECDIFLDKPYLSESTFEVVLLTQTGIRYMVQFKCESHHKLLCTFLSSNTRHMNADEARLSAKVIKEFMEADKKPPEPTPPNPTPPDGEGRGAKPGDVLLNQLRNSVFTEMYFLKSNGGRKYKITSGKFISKMNSFYAYQFELESEVFLADDSPVSVSCAAGNTEGKVLLCDGFEVILLLDSDLGNSISSGLISVEPWKLLESLNKRIEKINELGPIARKFLYTGPKLATKQPSSQIPKGQTVAKEHALSSDITVIWGPPGTGKTHTMSEIAISFLQQGKSVLLVSHSNVSVDGVAAKIAELLRAQNKAQYLRDGKVLRYGYIRDEKLASDPEASAYNYTLGKSTTYRYQLDQLTFEKDKAKAAHGKPTKEVLELEEKIKKLRHQIHLEERKYVINAKVVATTVSKIHADSLFEKLKYDVVMFDEVSMAYVAQILCAATFAKERFICVGDFRQLSPIAQSKAKDVLNRDVFAFLGISDGVGHIYAHPWLVMLDEQRRMHPGIAEFANNAVYSKLLKNHNSVYTSRESIVKRAPFSGHSMNLIDITGTYCATGKNSDNSRFNIISAVLSFGTAITAEKNGEKSVGIITPYAAQTRLVRAMIQDYRQASKTDTTCATVHQFQGSERNLIVFDAVESYPSTKTGWLMSKNDNGSVTRLINVAVTRARGKLVTVANRGYWKTKFAGSDHAFYKLVQHLLDKGNVVDVKSQQLRQYFSALDCGKYIQVITSPTEAASLFTADLGKAKKSLLVSIPGAVQFGTAEARMLEIFKEINQTGVRLMMKAKDLSALPKDWYPYTWDCDNAFLPTVLVDDKVLWYGFPKAIGTFMDGTTGFATVLPIWIRISGEHTVALIKSLAALDMRSQKGLDIPMSEKHAAQGGGIAAYVAKYETCPKCKHPMNLSKTATNKTILHCTRCGNTELFAKDSVNHYITKYHARCPQCGKEVYAGVSPKVGLYIRCTGGHFPKIEEI